MKNVYIYIIILGILFIAPIFVKDDTSRIIFQIIYFAALIVFSVLAWKQKRKNEIISYVFLMILGAVQAFDKDDKYFYIQLIVLVVFLIGLILQWKKNNKKETV